MICTEYMARTKGSRFQNCLPVFKEENVGCYNWGLVSGRTQTIIPWDWAKEGAEPGVWFHDIFHPDGTAYDPEEVTVIKDLVRG